MIIFLKRLSFGILILFLAAAVVFGPQASASLDEALAASGYIAKGLCFGVLMGEMDPDLLMEQEFAMGAGVGDRETDEVEVEASALFGQMPGEGFDSVGFEKVILAALPSPVGGGWKPISRWASFSKWMAFSGR